MIEKRQQQKSHWLIVMGSLKMSYKSSGICPTFGSKFVLQIIQVLNLSYIQFWIRPTDYSGPEFVLHSVLNCPTDYSGPEFVLHSVLNSSYRLFRSWICPTFSSEFVLQIIQVLNLSYIQFWICPTDYSGPEFVLYSVLNLSYRLFRSWICPIFSSEFVLQIIQVLNSSTIKYLQKYLTQPCSVI